jgi:hypothetical protein
MDTDVTYARSRPSPPVASEPFGTLLERFRATVPGLPSGDLAALYARLAKSVHGLMLLVPESPDDRPDPTEILGSLLNLSRLAIDGAESLGLVPQGPHTPAASNGAPAPMAYYRWAIRLEIDTWDGDLVGEAIQPHPFIPVPGIEIQGITGRPERIERVIWDPSREIFVVVVPIRGGDDDPPRARDVVERLGDGWTWEDPQPRSLRG